MAQETPQPCHQGGVRLALGWRLPTPMMSSTDLAFVTKSRYKTVMRHCSTYVKCVAFLALALLALAAAPHLHDETETSPDSCVLCHVHDTPITAASITAALPEPIALATGLPFANAHARVEALEGHGSRAPPA